MTVSKKINVGKYEFPTHEDVLPEKGLLVTVDLNIHH